MPRNLDTHLQVKRYGDFVLTDAIRPSADLEVVPSEGFRLDTYRDPQSARQIPVLAASVSREKLFDIFLALLEPLGEIVDVVLETSHDSVTGSHRDLCREEIDLPVLLSHFCDYEDMLLNDGCTGVAIMSPSQSMEVQFDEHKLLVVYARDLTPFRAILEQENIHLDRNLKLISESEHFHSTDPRFVDAFEQLSLRVGVGAEAEHVSW
jgi:hypothetical protein